MFQIVRKIFLVFVLAIFTLFSTAFAASTTLISNNATFQPGVLGFNLFINLAIGSADLANVMPGKYDFICKFNGKTSGANTVVRVDFCSQTGWRSGEISSVNGPFHVENVSPYEVNQFYINVLLIDGVHAKVMCTYKRVSA